MDYMHRPGIVPGSLDWETSILPLNHRCAINCIGRESNPSHSIGKRAFYPSTTDATIGTRDTLLRNEHSTIEPSRSPRSNTTRKQVCIPHCLKAKILKSVHSEYGGHLKFFKTYHRLSENFFWQNMYKDTKNFVCSCTICLSRKNAFKIPPAPHQPVEQSKEQGETCHMDIFVPSKTTPKDIRSSTISKAFFDNYIVHRGCPHKLVVDNATYFKRSEFVEFCRVMGIHKRHISSYSAHVNGRVEKPNQSLANILPSISQNTNDWDEQLPDTMLALNSAIHEATYTSPFFLEHGRDIRLSYTYEKNSDTPQNKHEYVEKLLPSLEHTFNKVLNNLKDQEASHVDLSTRATKPHHYDYKIGSLCFIKTPNIKSNLSPKLRPKFEATRGLLATDHVILNHGQVTWTTPELAPPLLTTTPHQREDVSALDRFNVHRCPTRRVFSGTGIELMTCLPWLDTLTTGLPQPFQYDAELV
ncbi:integrase catalytic domain-containing protein [Trichonephila clavipes]|nr:integrase catalytic domain-containing protein [Trichonephila clavipes]